MKDNMISHITYFLTSKGITDLLLYNLVGAASLVSQSKESWFESDVFTGYYGNDPDFPTRSSGE